MKLVLTDEELAGALNQMAERVHALAVDKGWYEEVKERGLNIGEKLCLIHSEVSEALEEYRSGETTLTGFRLDPTTKKPEGFAVELADALIRILDLCGALSIDIGAHVLQKHEFNRSRPYRHGGKKA